MATRYAILLYFPIEKIKEALLEVSQIVDVRSTISTRLELPDGEMLTLPLSWPNSPMQSLKYDKVVSYGFSILFPADDIIAAYVEKNARMWAAHLRRKMWISGSRPKSWKTLFKEWCVLKEDIRYFAIGAYDFTVTLDQQFVELEFRVVASDMNHLFTQSQNTRQVFQSILDAAGGVVGLLDFEELDMPLLENPAKSIHLPREIADTMTVDQIVELALTER